MMKKVLLIVPTLAGGGAERIVSYLSTGLPEDWKVDLLLRRKSITYSYREGCRIYETGTGLAGIWREWKLLRKLKKKGEYDVYNSHMASSNVLNLLSGKGGKRILTLHAVTSVQMREVRFGRIFNAVIRRFYPRADRIVAVSAAVRDDLLEHYHLPAEKTVTIENGNDLKRILTLRDQPLSKADSAFFETRPVITAMGRYAKAKGHRQLLAAFRRVLAVYPQAKLLIIGEGEERKNYEAYIRQLGISDHVVLTGYRENPFQLIAQSDVFAFSSVYEGYGCALAEALLCGVPCVTTQYCGFSPTMMPYEGECKEPAFLESGVLTPALDGNEASQQMFADAIIRLCGDREYGARCAAFNEKRKNAFSIEAMLSQWTDLMETV